ncbi:hypothetical protein [Cupriavidus sp. BIS7]|jgi:hypothetical protein|uniref:hypothetical protein n=1 Tax=Cupriavidus sp. BIS7 TaxID=1217718 RepID=UPI00037E9C74|nr:hypothetical protein [Cupriavidus sp. BIS7]
MTIKFERHMRIILAQMKRARFAALLCLLPQTSKAAVGDLGAVAIAALTIYAALWVSVTLAVFLLLRRKLSLAKCSGWSMLFLILLVPALDVFMGCAAALDQRSTYRTEYTREPLTVYGVDSVGVIGTSGAGPLPRPSP